MRQCKRTRSFNKFYNTFDYRIINSQNLICRWGRGLIIAESLGGPNKTRIDDQARPVMTLNDTFLLRNAS